jgi:hypothetical protein
MMLVVFHILGWDGLSLTVSSWVEDRFNPQDMTRYMELSQTFENMGCWGYPPSNVAMEHLNAIHQFNLTDVTFPII